MLIQYLASMLTFVGISAVLLLLGFQVASSITWQPTNPIYQLLHWIQDYLLLWLGVYLIVGWMIITYAFFARPLRYLDEIIGASAQLAREPERAIHLPAAIKNVEDELNLVREQSLRNSMAAREAEQRKNDLIIYLAHDLKTPLTSVIGYLTLLRDEPDISPEMRARYTGVALEKALHLEDLVNEFFDITRFSLTHLTLELERINLSRMLSQIAFEFNPILSEKSLEWALDIQPDVEIQCDPHKLERVFDNLIRNAVNYSYPETAVHLTMEASAEAVSIRIENQGRTIPPEKLDRIFEQFFRLDASRSSSTGGAGLGLAIAREIVELHGGSIRVESADERIAFTVVLPVSRQIPS